MATTGSKHYHDSDHVDVATSLCQSELREGQCHDCPSEIFRYVKVSYIHILSKSFL